ncbi:MAG: Pullulanase secretion protein PulG [Candidatus Accumulibacter appositus]|uniref:Pullulanase secretion protein PulG n=2 Tax=Candidatus Accumulibacter TaxID=327159 RepID=A0A011N3E2_9PROT|nr:MAG: Pullulanase secretion protein PulG [Candidatus Accumulibacter appositus]
MSGAVEQWLTISSPCIGMPRAGVRAVGGKGGVGGGEGFSLIELLITLAVVAVLSGIVVPVAQTAIQRGKEQELRLALRELRSAIDQYKKAGDEGRIRTAANDSGYPANLQVLLEGEVDLRDPKQRKIYFLRRIPRDPLHPDSRLQPADTWAKRAYASGPDNPREGDDVYDVYSKSTGVGLNGVPYRQW